MALKCRPVLDFLDPKTLATTIDKAYGLLGKPGIRINNSQVLDMLGQYGAKVDMRRNIACMGPDLIDSSLKTVPATIELYNAHGEKVLTLGQGRLSFVAGSSAPFILDADTRRPRAAQTADLIQFLRLSDGLSSLQHSNPALIPADVPEKIRDVFRCFLAMMNTAKPLAVGMVQPGTLDVLKDMLVLVAGGLEKMRSEPRLTFACTTRSPLTWDATAAQYLTDCARYGIPVRMIPAPISGATAPASLLGTVVQHTAENMSGLVMHQLAGAGAPLIWGTAATLMDMKSGASLFGSIESKMINVANCRIAEHLDIPSYALFAFSDAKVVDAQAGLESISGTLLGVLGGSGMLGGAGMLESGLCQSFEKLVIDNEVCGMGQRLAQGMSCAEDAFAAQVIESIGPGGKFLSSAHTLAWARREQYYPSKVFHRSSRADFQQNGCKDSYLTARDRVLEILQEYQPRALSEAKKRGLQEIMSAFARQNGEVQLPSGDIRENMPTR